jgi:putative transposase
MSRKYKFHDSSKLYFVSFALVYWIDLFIRQEYKNIVLESWKFCINNKGMELYGWCMMSSHIHMIIVTNKEKLEDIMRDMKRHTSVQLR